MRIPTAAARRSGPWAGGCGGVEDKERVAATAADKSSSSHAPRIMAPPREPLSPRRRSASKSRSSASPHPPPTPSHPPSPSHADADGAYDEENDTSPPDAGLWPAFFHAAFYAARVSPALILHPHPTTHPGRWRRVQRRVEQGRETLDDAFAGGSHASSASSSSYAANTSTSKRNGGPSAIPAPSAGARTRGGVHVEDEPELFGECFGEGGRTEEDLLGTWTYFFLFCDGEDGEHPAHALCILGFCLGASVTRWEHAVTGDYHLPPLIPLHSFLPLPRFSSVLVACGCATRRHISSSSSTVGEPPLIPTLAPPFSARTRFARPAALLVPRRAAGAVWRGPHGAGEQGRGGGRGDVVWLERGSGALRQKYSRRRIRRLSRPYQVSSTTPHTIFAIADEPPTWPGADDDDIGLESISDPEEAEEEVGWMTAMSRAPRMHRSRTPRTVSQTRRTPRPRRSLTRTRSRRTMARARSGRSRSRTTGTGLPPPGSAGDACDTHRPTHPDPRDDEGVRRWGRVLRCSARWGAGAADDLGLGLDGDETLLLGAGVPGAGTGMGVRWVGVNPSHPPFHSPAVTATAAAQQAIRPREVYAQQQAMGMGVPLGMGVPIGAGGCLLVSASHRGSIFTSLSTSSERSGFRAPPLSALALSSLPGSAL
ncbi:hypothetical protein B0H10DRAFT_2213273 [Mycena sp. CBHHK59/15]|nr:hypothetical protein B0H10DRAFT_2213273 [Mycena sp. CBHHK59/15]